MDDIGSILHDIRSLAGVINVNNLDYDFLRESSQSSEPQTSDSDQYLNLVSSNPMVNSLASDEAKDSDDLDAECEEALSQDDNEESAPEDSWEYSTDDRFDEGDMSLPTLLPQGKFVCEDIHDTDFVLSRSRNSLSEFESYLVGESLSASDKYTRMRGIVRRDATVSNTSDEFRGRFVDRVSSNDLRGASTSCDSGMTLQRYKQVGQSNVASLKGKNVGISHGYTSPIAQGQAPPGSRTTSQLQRQMTPQSQNPMTPHLRKRLVSKRGASVLQSQTDHQHSDSLDTSELQSMLGERCSSNQSLKLPADNLDSNYRSMQASENVTRVDQMQVPSGNYGQATGFDQMDDTSSYVTDTAVNMNCSVPMINLAAQNQLRTRSVEPINRIWRSPPMRGGSVRRSHASEEFNLRGTGSGYQMWQNDDDPQPSDMPPLEVIVPGASKRGGLRRQTKRFQQCQGAMEQPVKVGVCYDSHFSDNDQQSCVDVNSKTNALDQGVDAESSTSGMPTHRFCELFASLLSDPEKLLDFVWSERMRSMLTAAEGRTSATRASKSDDNVRKMISRLKGMEKNVKVMDRACTSAEHVGNPNRHYNKALAFPSPAQMRPTGQGKSKWQGVPLSQPCYDGRLLNVRLVQRRDVDVNLPSVATANAPRVETVGRGNSILRGRGRGVQAIARGVSFNCANIPRPPQAMISFDSRLSGCCNPRTIMRSNPQIVGGLHPQMFQGSNTQMAGGSNVRMIQDSNSQMAGNLNIRMVQASNRQLTMVSNQQSAAVVNRSMTVPGPNTGLPDVPIRSTFSNDNSVGSRVSIRLQSLESQPLSISHDQANRSSMNSVRGMGRPRSLAAGSRFQAPQQSSVAHDTAVWNYVSGNVPIMRIRRPLGMNLSPVPTGVVSPMRNGVSQQSTREGDGNLGNSVVRSYEGSLANNSEENLEVSSTGHAQLATLADNSASNVASYSLRDVVNDSARSMVNNSARNTISNFVNDSNISESNSDVCTRGLFTSDSLTETLTVRNNQRPARAEMQRIINRAKFWSINGERDAVGVSAGRCGPVSSCEAMGDRGNVCAQDAAKNYSRSTEDQKGSSESGSGSLLQVSETGNQEEPEGEPEEEPEELEDEPDESEEEPEEKSEEPEDKPEEPEDKPEEPEDLKPEAEDLEEKINVESTNATDTDVDSCVAGNDSSDDADEKPPVLRSIRKETGTGGKTDRRSDWCDGNLNKSKTAENIMVRPKCERSLGCEVVSCVRSEFSSEFNAENGLACCSRMKNGKIPTSPSEQLVASHQNIKRSHSSFDRISLAEESKPDLHQWRASKHDDATRSQVTGSLLANEDEACLTDDDDYDDKSASMMKAMMSDMSGLLAIVSFLAKLDPEEDCIPSPIALRKRGHCTEIGSDSGESRAKNLKSVSMDEQTTDPTVKLCQERISSFSKELKPQSDSKMLGSTCESKLVARSTAGGIDDHENRVFQHCAECATAILARKPLNPAHAPRALGAWLVQECACAQLSDLTERCRECRAAERGGGAREGGGGEGQGGAGGKLHPHIVANCRFYAFRRLRVCVRGLEARGPDARGFSDPSEADADHVRLWLVDPGRVPPDPPMSVAMALYIVGSVGAHFCGLVEQEREALAWDTTKASVVWKRAVHEVREMCDSCETTIFNVHWACGRCGYVVCLDCYRAATRLSCTRCVGAAGCSCLKWLTCTGGGMGGGGGWMGKRGGGKKHIAELMLLTQIIPGDALFVLGRRLHDVCRKWHLRVNCDCIAEISLRLANPAQSSSNTPSSHDSSRRNVAGSNGTEPCLQFDDVDKKDLKLFCPGKLSTVGYLEGGLGNPQTVCSKSLKLGDLIGLTVAQKPSQSFSCNGAAKQPIKVKKHVKLLLLEKPVCPTPPNLLRISSTDNLKGGSRKISLRRAKNIGQKMNDHETIVRDTASHPSDTPDLPAPALRSSLTGALFPDTPHTWLDNGRLLQLLDPFRPANVRLFRAQWRHARPVLVSNCQHALDPLLWTPESFRAEFGDQVNDLIDCGRKAVVTGHPMRAFWDGFERVGARLKDDSGRPMVLKLKDWPPTEDFCDVLPSRFNNLLQALPLPDYTRRDGCFNLVSCLPPFFVRPDLGPKMYNAYGSAMCPRVGSTNLHLDVSDAVNLIMYVGVPTDDASTHEQAALKAMEEAGCCDATRARVFEKGEKIGALWHIFDPQDAVKIREMLHKVGEESGEPAELDADPIHDQSWYLDEGLRARLLAEHGVQGYTLVQCVGDAIFIPAGAPHQVRNLHSCIKAAEDFVSPENLGNCFRMMQEFRHLSDTHTNHEDKLQVKNVIYHAIKDAVAVLQTSDPD